MDVQYITVKSNKLATVPIVDGQIIAISDKDAWFYDMEGVRRIVSGQKIVTALPENTESIYPDTVYIVLAGDAQGIHVWDGSKFSRIASINTDENIKSTPTQLGQSYIIGSPDARESIGSGNKHTDVYIDNPTGKIRANGFIGGPADRSLSADKASLADKATADNKNQNIASTYIKSLKSEGTQVTATYGDGSTKSFHTQDTNTHNVTNVVFTSSPTSQENLVAKNGQVHLNISDDNSLRSSHKIAGSGSIEVTSDASGNLDIKGQDTWRPNTSTQEGYVSAGKPNSTWSTDSQGNPGWVNTPDPYTHPNSGVQSGSYTKVTVNAQGHVTGGSNPNTLAGYGIVDAARYNILANDADLNTQLEPGFYVGLSGNAIKNKPTDVDSFGMIVAKTSNSGYARQILFGSGEAGTTTNQYSREAKSNTFTSWSINKLTDTVYQHPTGSGFMHLPAGGRTGQVLIWKSSGEAEWGNPCSVTVAVMEGSTATTSGKAGLVPAPDAGPAESYLRNDGTWSIPPDTKYTEMVGTDGTQSGKSGLVPAPTSAQAGMYLGSDGNWHKIEIPVTAWEEFIPQ